VLQQYITHIVHIHHIAAI